MIQPEIRYFSLNKILLLVIGLWPYQQSKFTRFQFIFFSTILTAGIIFQLTTLITSECTLNFVSKVLSSTSLYIFYMINYDSFYINIKVVKDLVMQLEQICNQVKDKNEIAIIEEYNYIARRHTIILIIFAIIAGFIFIIVLPKNISHLPIVMEYFIDQEKYFYLILLHIYAFISIGGITMLAVGTLLLTYFQYVCGIFKIASYRIEHAININIRQNNTLKNNLMREGLICAIDIHRQAMKLSENFFSKFEVMMFCLIIFGVACLSLNLFQIFQIVSSKNTVYEFYITLFHVVIITLYIFLANYVGQNITDHNNYVFSTAYNVPWYRAPLHVQRMILFLLQRKTKALTLNVGGIFTGSMECFATLVNTSVSYFTVIYSTR